VQPTTVTSIVMIVFAAAVVALALYNLFGSWEPVVRRVRPPSAAEAEIEAAVREMRRAIEDYERERMRP
jgi:cytochrome c-type biogenesis protein CcmH/NrfG